MQDPTASPAEELPTGRIPSRVAAEEYLVRRCFAPRYPHQVGLELEWLVYDATDPHRPPDLAKMASALGRWWPQGDSAVGRPLPCGSRLTLEPGGQLEVSTVPETRFADVVADALTDLHTVESALAPEGMVVAGWGSDPFRVPRRLVTKPRYIAMEEYYDRHGDAGRVMMGATAAVQVSLDAGCLPGDEGPPPVHPGPVPVVDLVDRWRLLVGVGPPLVAAFANSPALAGEVTGWRSTRQRTWLSLDSHRATPPQVRAGDDPREAYARYVLGAPLLAIRRPSGDWRAPDGLTFADWIGGALAEQPTFDDLAYHATTLFPPIRAQGYLEVRYLDAQEGLAWVVPAAVLWGLTQSRRAAEKALAAAESVEGRWREAAQVGLADPAMARAAAGVLEAAQEELAAVGVPGVVQDAVEIFADRFTRRGRCPADAWQGARPPDQPPLWREDSDIIAALFVPSPPSASGGLP